MGPRKKNKEGKTMANVPVVEKLPTPYWSFQNTLLSLALMISKKVK